MKAKAHYRCRLCQKRVEKEIPVEDGGPMMVFAFNGQAQMIQHGCWDGYKGIADFVGYEIIPEEGDGAGED